ncbi:UDP-GlcNAc:a-1,3-D-mannoside b-1,4-N-Acetylglucosaminyltransfe rase IV [Loa loa]|nr:UDP-GlcNAc:a-1,3-D-mannoside b-1,4-N-Acetylglucosaminyltransfe rase IV [Loa loa]EFO21313.2 UDP-GlcNAc:a-1,3-D-mannoside b-1,4-N-Acetylglucosaminyltransfe rase IV [Loa loa]
MLLKDRVRECYLSNNLPKFLTNDSKELALPLPTVVDFLPHLYTVPNNALRPALIYPNNFSRMTKTDLVIGIPTVARRNHSYLIPTLQSVIGGIASSEIKMVSIIVLISDGKGSNSSFVKYQCTSLQSEFPHELNSGLLTVIVPPSEWYPDLYSVTPTFNDSPERMYWRTKQNLDYIYLMLYSQQRGEYYLQLEDDVLAKAGYVSRIRKFIDGRASDDWLMLEFSSLGFIGKLFRTSDLTLLLQFIAMFHKQKPVDWLLDLLFINRYCNPGNSTKHCAETVKQHRIRHRPSLFQHMGVHSSLAGKIQKLRERDFGKAQFYIPHRDNPPAKITTTLKTYMLFDIENAYTGSNYYWAFAPVAQDYILFDFYSAIALIGIVIRTGNPEHQDDILSESAEVLLRKVNEDSFISIARFNERGTVRVDFTESIRVNSLKIEIHEGSSNWLIINEMHIIVE